MQNMQILLKSKGKLHQPLQLRRSKSLILCANDQYICIFHMNTLFKVLQSRCLVHPLCSTFLEYIYINIRIHDKYTLYGHSIKAHASVLIITRSIVLINLHFRATALMLCVLYSCCIYISMYIFRCININYIYSYRCTTVHIFVFVYNTCLL